MPGTAATLSILFLLLAVAWRGFVQYRRTGDVGFRRPLRSAGLVEKIAGILLGVGVLGLLLSPVCAMAGLAAPSDTLDRSIVHGVGLVLACFGIGMTVLAEFQMGDSWRVGVDPSETTPLVAQGLFAYVRNPIYSGMMAFALGLLCLVPTTGCAVAGLVFAIGVQVQVRGVEEPHLLDKHGAAYAQYARAAGRFVPWMGRLS